MVDLNQQIRVIQDHLKILYSADEESDIIGFSLEISDENIQALKDVNWVLWCPINSSEDTILAIDFYEEGFDLVPFSDEERNCYVPYEIIDGRLIKSGE